MLTPPSKINNVITKDKSKTGLAKYVHPTVFSPSFLTFQKVIDNGNFITWPGIMELHFKVF